MFAEFLILNFQLHQHINKAVIQFPINVLCHFNNKLYITKKDNARIIVDNSMSVNKLLLQFTPTIPYNFYQAIEKQTMVFGNPFYFIPASPPYPKPSKCNGLRI